MATAQINLSGSVIGLATGGKTIATSVTSALANGQVQQLVLQAGANTITVPTAPAPTGVVIQLPLANTSQTTLKGVTGDTGIAIGKTGFVVLNWDPTAVPASFVLTSVSTQTGLITELTFY